MWFCKHKWFEKERYEVTRIYTWDGHKVPNCLVIMQECSKCGKLKKVDFP